MPLGSFRLNSLARYIAAIPPAPGAEDTSSKYIQYIGTAEITNIQSKFGGTSFRFPASGDCIRIWPYEEFDFEGDFTVEGWFWLPTDTNWQVLWASGYGGNDLYQNWNGGLIGYVNYEDYRIRSNSGLTTEAWNHIAVVRSGTTVTQYHNGTSVGTTTVTLNLDVTEWTIGGPHTGSGDGNQRFRGYIDEFRMSNVARYTSNFTAPSAAFTWDSDTVLLLNADSFNTSKAASDNNNSRQAINLSEPTTSTVTLSSTQKKFGNSSLYFPGTTANSFVGSIYRNNKTFLPVELIKWWNDPGWTLEYWFYTTDMDSLTPSSTTVGGGLVRQGWNNADPGGQWWGFGPKRDGEVRFTAFAGPHRNFVTTGAGITVNTWHHVAFVFNYNTSVSNSTVTIYVNGVNKFSQTVGSDGPYIAGDDSTNDIIGFAMGTNGTVSGDNFQGYIDELRVSKVARYTANFTPATTAFVNDADTVLLLHGEGTVGQRIIRDDNSRIA
jgi:hypothetical protein